MNNDSLRKALETIKELDSLYDTDNIIVIGQLCNKLSNLSVGLGKQMTDADKLFNQLKDEYENLVENKKLELIESGVGVGKAESQAKVQYYQQRKDYRIAEHGYEQLKTFLSRIDKVLDSNKQYASTVKSTNLKGI
ncbi:MAG TPA: hypothetical protein VD927_06325 [Chryseosolibacter sp.]|nr:hypothetical protein [Chryseosolibacter sp.]